MACINLPVQQQHTFKPSLSTHRKFLDAYKETKVSSTSIELLHPQAHIDGIVPARDERSSTINFNIECALIGDNSAVGPTCIII